VVSGPVTTTPAAGGGSGGAPKTMPKAGEGREGEGDVRVRRPATVIVKAAEDVKITVNGQETPRRSTEESFLTPNLPVGRNYDYLFTAEARRGGKKVTRTERISVRPGETTEVDFRDMDRAVVSSEPARVTVVLPAGARLYVNGVAVEAKGKQTFQTPSLRKGRTFYYTVKAELMRGGRKVTESQRVSVEAGKAVTVDFTAAKATLTARR
jgi:uncharacterized protein (TIGR03000 family)